MKAGYKKISIDPGGDIELAGTYNRHPRIGNDRRDGLFARALALESDGRRIILIAADLLCISEELHRSLCDSLGGFDKREIFLAATHTHSSFGGYFLSDAASAMLGRPDMARFNELVSVLKQAVEGALADLADVDRIRAGQGVVPGLVSSRRKKLGPYDDTVNLVRLERRNKSPIELLAVSGHPVIVLEHNAKMISADYPGEVCRRLEDLGIAPIFFSSALGGESILFPEFQMGLERHMELVAGLILGGRDRAQSNSREMQAGKIHSEIVYLERPKPESRIFSPMGLPWSFLDFLLMPLLEKFGRTFDLAFPLEQGVPIHLVEVGAVLLVGTPFDLGVSISRRISEIGRAAGRKLTVALSQTDAYAGYIHMPAVYESVPEKGYRFMALYENALAMFGTGLGRKVVRAVEEKLKNGIR
ncbi:MAG: hypothetical protein GXP49_08820 [Deltaproteobacteria bacterium]|nr:hypothetical protein [Deltaproteobacteria bacterium]